MISPFFAVISVPLVCARMLQGCHDHRGVTLVWLWFLDQALAPRLADHFKSSLASLVSTLHFTGATKRPHFGETFCPISFALGLWRPGYIVLQTNNVIITVKGQGQWGHKCILCLIHALHYLYFIDSICCAYLLLCWLLSWNTQHKIGSQSVNNQTAVVKTQLKCTERHQNK